MKGTAKGTHRRPQRHEELKKDKGQSVSRAAKIIGTAAKMKTAAMVATEESAPRPTVAPAQNNVRTKIYLHSPYNIEYAYLLLTSLKAKK